MSDVSAVTIFHFVRVASILMLASSVLISIFRLNTFNFRPNNPLFRFQFSISQYWYMVIEKINLHSILIKMDSLIKIQGDSALI